MTGSKKFRALVLLGWLVGCGAPEPSGHRIMLQTTARVRAPMNLGGKVVILQRGHENERSRGRVTPYDARIDADAEARFDELRDLEGDVVVEVTGGHFTDPVTGQTVWMRGETLHGYARNIQFMDDVQLAVTPWTELLYRYMRKHPEAEQMAAAEDALGQALGCGTRNFVRALAVRPSESAPLLAAGDAEVAYLHLGAWAKLAQAVGREVGGGAAGVSIMQLTRALGDVIDRTGHIAGPIEVLPGKFVASDLLRQRFAQAMRQFVEGKPKHLQMGTEPIKGFLECTSQAPADMWGPAGEKLDMEGPRVALEAPAVFATATQVQCQAHDESTIKSLQIQIRQENALVRTEATPGEDRAGIATPVATLLTTLDPNYLQDGNISVTCIALDKWDNATSRAMTVAVNRGLGKVTTDVAPADSHDLRSYVKAAVSVTCTCDDKYPVQNSPCGLAPESLATPGMGQAQVAPGRTSYLWDTTQGTDGKKHLVCQSRSQGLEAPTLSAPQYVWVGNFKPVSVIGEVHLDTPVEGMRVTAYAFEDGRRGAELGQTDAPKGEFALSISNEYVGPLLIEAAPVHALGQPKPAYTSLAFGEPVFVEAHRLSLLWDDYTPARGLPSVLHINAATTLATSLALGIYEHSQSGEALGFQDAIRRAHDLVGKHIQPNGSLDPRTTAVSDLSRKDSIRGANNVLLGLFHVGLSRLAAEISQEGPRDYASLALLTKLGEDALSGVLDGREAVRHGQLGLGHYPLTEATLRRDLAAATRRWLRNDELHGQKHVMSQLDVHAYSHSGQYLVTLAQDNSAMFGGVDGRTFDEDGPELTLRIRQDGSDRDWTDMPAGQIFRGFIYLEAQAADDSDVLSIDVDFGGMNLVDGLEGVRGSKYTLGAPTAHAQFTVNSALFPDGEVSIMLTARDRLGNPSEMPMLIRIDNTPPQITVAPQQTSRDGNATIAGDADKAIRAARAMHDRTEVGRYLIDPNAQDTQSFAIPVQVPCDAAYALTIIATDDAGNDSEPQQVSLRCDAQPPVIHWVPTGFQQEYTGQRVPMQDGVVLQKHLHRLGLRDSNPAAVRFYVDDQVQGRFGSRPQNMRAQYRFEFHNQGRTRTTEWRPLEATQDTDFPEGMGYRVAFTYETMLPDDLLRLDLVSIRAANYIARCASDDEHVLVVRVEDEAGNSAEGRFTARLDIRSTPVQLNCQTYSFGDVSQSASLSPMQVAHLTQPGHRPLSVSAAWKIPDAEAADASELAPQMSDASVVLVMPVANQRIRIGQTTRQVAVLKRSTPYDQQDEGAWCQDHGKSWARAWSDGECEPHMGDTRGESTRIVKTAAFEQRLVPQTSSIRLRGASPDFVKVAYAMQDGATLQAVRDVHGRERLQYRFRTAVEYERHVPWPGSPDRVWLDERLFADALLTHQTLSGGHASVDAFPAPSRVVYGPGCQRTWLFRGQPG